MKKVDKAELKKLRGEYNRTSNRAEMKTALDDRCCNCGCDTDIEYHHIVPLLLGGTNNITNIAPICYACHKLAHGSENINNIRDKTNSGRKPNTLPDNYKQILDDYLNGNIGRKECQEKLNVNGTAKLTDKKFFKEYLKEKGIKTYRNNVDTLNQSRLKNRTTKKVLISKIVFLNGEVLNKYSD